MHEWLLNSPIVRLFVIIALGYLVGEIKFPGGFRLGVAGVLFVGLACGAVSPGMELPAEVQTLGLVLFVYCIGLQAAPGFFKSFKRDGLALNLSVLAGLMLALLCAYLALRWSGRAAPLITGVFCGALTSTPALGAVTESIINGGGTAADASLAVVGYGVAYPVAIVLVLLLAQALSVRTRSNEPADTSVSPIPTALTIAVEALGPDGQPWLADIVQRQTGVVLSRQRNPNGRIELVADATALSPGGFVVAVGNPEQLKSAIALLGRVSPTSLQQELNGFDVHRYFVSKPQAVEKPVGELGLEKLGAVVTRLRRGDIDLPVTHDTRLQLGDRVQVISYKDRERAVREFFGNSLTVFTETGYFSFTVGIILGLILGQIPIPVPGLSQPVRLGVAGGPLVVALILGSRGRTGPFIWSIPAEVNLTLRHLGILFFLAAVGVKAGHGLLTHLQTDGWTILAVSVAVIATAHLTLLAVLRFFGQRELATLLGVVSALQTQPAVLTFSATKAPSGPLNTAYAATYPLAMILKIILAQVLIALA